MAKKQKLEVRGGQNFKNFKPDRTSEDFMEEIVLAIPSHAVLV